jgi:hypothetical protein
VVPQPPTTPHTSSASVAYQQQQQQQHAAIAALAIPEVTTLPFSPLRASVVAHQRRQQQQLQAIAAAQSAAAALHYHRRSDSRAGGDGNHTAPSAEPDELTVNDFESTSDSDTDSSGDDDPGSGENGNASAAGASVSAPTSGGALSPRNGTNSDGVTPDGVPAAPYLNPHTKEAREKLRDVMRERMRWRHDIEKMREREAMLTGRTRHSSSAREWERVAMARSERKLPSPPPPPVPVQPQQQPHILPAYDQHEAVSIPRIIAAGSGDIDPHAAASVAGSVQAAAVASKAGIARAIQHAREVADIETMFHRSGATANTVAGHATTPGIGGSIVPSGLDDVDDAVSAAERAKFYLRSRRVTNKTVADPNQKKESDETATTTLTASTGGPERLLRFKGKTQFAAYRVRGERVQQKQRARIYKKLSQTRDLNQAIQNLGERETVPVVLTKLTRLPWRGNFEAFQVPLNQAFSYLAAADKKN